MRCGITLFIQAYQDWDRFEAAERGEPVPALDPAADATRFQEEIESALELEDLGFDSLWTVEHHVSPYTMVTNPIQLLTFFAGATSRMDVGTMVAVLPWHHPLRMAEDITMLQYALRGRTPYIGFGRGAGRREFRQLGLKMEESKERFSESVDIVKLALSQESFSYAGEYYNFENITMRPRPRDAQQIIDNLHFSWGTPSSAPVGARHGLKPLIIPQKPWAEYVDDLASFSAARSEVGLEPVRPRIHMNAICAETEEEARALAYEFVPQYADSAARNYETAGGHFASIKGYEHYAAIAEAAGGDKDAVVDNMAQTYLDNHLWGTPEQCIAKLQKIADLFHPEEFMLVMRFGNMPREVADKSTALFAREVLPAVHEFAVREPITYQVPAGV
ncbi:LLM class flavin-dependent oxidoreductase [Mycobacterium sp. UM_CSW]|uniref:LLM class flavin-dependent oxidoreductase n=1 Tax=Mycobacterium sp. UM_CSW TaxID=1370119 RepID=UPI0003F8F5F2|nr:LLM class flavin-dependent oxidoreductase [Mycobacterium sp. UM_CSW]